MKNLKIWFLKAFGVAELKSGLNFKILEFKIVDLIWWIKILKNF